MKKRVKKFSFFKMIQYMILTVSAIVALAPFYFMTVASFKPGRELLRKGMNFSLPAELMTLENYALVFTGRDGVYLHWYKNSVLITLLFTVLSLVLTSMVGYGLAVYKFKGRNLIFTTVLVVMMIPVEILLIPLYKLTIFMRLVDTVWGVILPFIVSPFAIFFFRQYVTGISKDFRDAGRIDGCTEFGIYVKIMVPLMLPAFGAMTILQAMASWNNYMWPLIVLRSNESFTLPIGLNTLITPYGNSYDMLMPGALLSVLPMVIMYMLNQKAFISGLTIGGVKG